MICYPVKIVGCVVDVHNLTMYKADGDTIVIPQGDPRVKDLVALLVPALDPSKPLAERFLILTGDEMRDKNHFAETEKAMGGVVRFFKMAKAAAKKLLEKFVEPVAPLELGDKREAIKDPPKPILTVNGNMVNQGDPVHVVEPVKAELPPAEERPLTKSEAAVAEIMAAAESAGTVGFSTPDAKGHEETTVIAVLADNTIIPGCEALLDQAQAVAEGISSGAGMENFLRRAGMIQRGHSVEDLLKFIQKGELPIADDGCVLVYKLLNRVPGKEGLFADCHSGNVFQRVGSKVQMAEHLVDARRSVDCSNGLHVARRDYLQNFHGDVCVLAKLAPEDVIAVPQYDARKLRAKGYHIIAELSATDRELVRINQPMEDQVLLGNAIKGNHAEIIEYVEITEGYGGGLVVTKVEGAVGGMPALDEALLAQSLDHLPTAEFSTARNSVDARALALKTAEPATVPIEMAGVGVIGHTTKEFVDEIKASLEPKETVSESPAAPIRPIGTTTDGRKVEAVNGVIKVEPVKASQAKPIDLLVQALKDTEKGSAAEHAAATALVNYKKQSKKSWTALGVSILVFDAAVMIAARPQPVIAAPAPKVKAVKPVAPKLPAVAQAVLGAAKPSAVKPVAKPVKAKASPAKKVDLGPHDAVVKAPSKPKLPKELRMTQQEAMANLVNIYNRNPDKQNAKEIVAFKQKAKKSWDVLGVTDAKFIKKITERAKL